MNSKLINALVRSILFAVFFPMIPSIVIGIAWLCSFGGFEFLSVVRTTPMVLLSGLIACVSVIDGFVEFEDKYGF